jgi:hypothetical protein
VKVLGTPSSGRCCFIRTWPTPGILTLPFPRGLPGPTQFPSRHTWGKVKLSHQPRPRKRGYPAFSPRFTREKKPWKARSSRFRVSCKTWAYTPWYSGLTALTSPNSRIWSYTVTDFPAFFQASRRSCKAALYSSRVRSRIRVRAASCALVEQACREALGRGVRRLLIAGDLIDAKNIAKWSAERSHRLEDELDVARRVIAALAGAFETHIILGNHDDRIAKKLDRELSTHRVLEWLLGDGVKVYRHHQAFVGQGWLVAHPGSYSRLPGKPALELSAKYSRHVAIAHTHKWTATRDTSGGRWIIELGGCFNPRSMDYIHRELRTFPHPQQGALILTRAEQPVLLHPELG